MTAEIHSALMKAVAVDDELEFSSALGFGVALDAEGAKIVSDEFPEGRDATREEVLLYLGVAGLIHDLNHPTLQ